MTTMTDEASRQIENVAAAARSLEQTADGVTEDLIATFDRSLKKKPLTTLTLGVGLVVGAIVKR